MDGEMEDGEINRSPVYSKDASLDSLSLSEPDDTDSLEIKPPQAQVHIHKHRKKHSSSSVKRHSGSEHRKKHHHSRSRREERHRHHRERDRVKEEALLRGVKEAPHGRRERHGREESRLVMGDMPRSDSMGSRAGPSGTSEELQRRYHHDVVLTPEERDRAVRAARGRDIERDVRRYGPESDDFLFTSRNEKKRMALSAQQAASSAASMSRLETLGEKEREERDLRRQRLMEAERVKETYRKAIEERRARREKRERSRSRERKLVAEAAEAAAIRAAAQAEMERAGLVVLSDESQSPVMPSSAERITAFKDTDEESDPDNEQQKNGKKAAGGDTTESSGETTDSSTDSDESEEDSEVDEAKEKADAVRRRLEEASPPPKPAPPSGAASDGNAVNQTNQVETEKEKEEETIELAKDTLPPYLPAIQGCRSVEEFQHLNRIDEGAYGVVYRARDKRTNEIVALKRLKMEKEKEGFPITSLREINTLLKAQHPNIVTVREIVVGSNMDKIFIVMEYVEHDLKSLMETMKQKKQVFLAQEVKCLMRQLLAAVAHLHDNWILHRDLKASNLLLSHKGILKVGDFGLAREYGSPLKPYTSIVVTLWYRAPELLLGIKEYSTPIDMWSVGCIFAELLTMEPLFTAKTEVALLNRIFKTLGTPNERIWPGYNKLPVVQKMSFTEFPVSTLKNRFSNITLTELGYSLLTGFLTYCPSDRLTAEAALKHEYFNEVPLPIDPAMFPSWPAKSEGGPRKQASPKPPSGGRDYKQAEDNDEGFHMGQVDRNRISMGSGFSLKF